MNSKRKRVDFTKEQDEIILNSESNLLAAGRIKKEFGIVRDSATIYKRRKLLVASGATSVPVRNFKRKMVSKIMRNDTRKKQLSLPFVNPSSGAINFPAVNMENNHLTQTNKNNSNNNNALELIFAGKRMIFKNTPNSITFGKDNTVTVE